MIQEIREQYHELDRGSKALRATGVVFAAALAVLAALGWFKGWVLWPGLAGLAAAMGLVAWLRPRWLLWPHNAWMLLALCMGWVVSRVLLTLIFYLVVTPTAVIMRMVGKDPLDRRLGDRDSYWHVTPEQEYDPAETERMY